MQSRREFIQSGSLLLAGIPETAAQQEAPKIEPQTAARDYWNDLPSYLIAKVNAARTERKADLAKVKSADDVNTRASFVRTRVWDLIGGQLQKTPLNARTTGVIERDRYRIEKLLFESQPEFYVTAHLYC